MSDPANTMLRPEDDQKPLVEQVEEERAEEDRETFITESGLVEEVEEEDAKVGAVLGQQQGLVGGGVLLCLYGKLWRAVGTRQARTEGLITVSKLVKEAVRMQRCERLVQQHAAVPAGAQAVWAAGSHMVNTLQ